MKREILLVIGGLQRSAQRVLMRVAFATQPRRLGGDPLKAGPLAMLTSARKILFAVCLAGVLGSGLIAFTGVVEGQDPLSTLLQASALLASAPPDSAHEELPGMGHKFELFGSAADAQDPDNITNDVISTELDLVSNFFGGALRRLPPGIKIAALDNQLNLKYRFTAPRTCFGGSPRITLFIDANGDGQFVQAPSGPDFAAQGHVNPPLFAACPQNEWRIEDMSDGLKRWETTPATVMAPPCGPIGAITTCTWDELEMRVTANFPNHRVFAGGLIDDTFGGPGQSGTAHYDLITVENRTLENRQDTVP